MSLSYRFYRNNLIKAGILSVACLGIFWDWFHGKSKDDGAAMFLIALFIVAGNTFLFLAMRRAKRREEAEKLEISARLAGKTARDSDGRVLPNISPTSIVPRTAETAAHQRKKLRIVMLVWCIGGGILCCTFGSSFLVEGVPAPWVGYVLIGVGILGFLGANVFIGGPLDRRMDRKQRLQAGDKSRG